MSFRRSFHLTSFLAILLGSKVLEASIVDDSFYSLKQVGQEISAFGARVAINNAADFIAIGTTGAVKVFSLQESSSPNCEVNFTKPHRIHRVHTELQGSKCWVQFGETLEGDAGDRFGWSIAMNDVGNMIIIGAIGSDVDRGLNGYAKVYSVKYDPRGNPSSSCMGKGNDKDLCLKQVGERIEGDADSVFWGAAVSINANGDSILVGSPKTFVPRLYPITLKFFSRVKVFENDSSTCDNKSNGRDLCWKQVGQTMEFEVSPLVGADLSLSMNQSGSTIIIVPPIAKRTSFVYEKTNESIASHKYVDGIFWKQVGQNITSEAFYSRNADSVAMNNSGKRVIIGSSSYGRGWDKDQVYKSGLVQVFQLDHASCLDKGLGLCWSQLGQNIVGEEKYDKLGWAVSMNHEGDLIGVSSYRKRGGSLRVYKLRDDYVDGNKYWDLVSEKANSEDCGAWRIEMSSTGKILVASYGQYCNGRNDGWKVIVYNLVPVPCVDSPRRFYRNEKLRPCKWLEQDSGKHLKIRCSKPGVSSHCPNTCQACGDYICKDSKNKFKLNNRTRQCGWVRKFDRCSKKGMKETCRESCGYCQKAI